MSKTIQNRVAIVLCIIMVSLSGCTKGTPAGSTSQPSAAAETKSEELLGSWSDGTDSTKDKLIEYVQAVTDEDNKDRFVPIEDRVATFDMDGTIVCEKESSIEYDAAKYRIQTDLKDNTELNEKLNQLIADFQMDPYPDNIWQLNGEVMGEAFGGMTGDDIEDYIADFAKTQDWDEASGLKYVDTFYQPMVELLSYLQANDFDVYIVSGSSQEAVWGCVKAYNETYTETPITLERSHMIGSDMQVIGSKDEAANNDTYVFQPDDLLVRGDHQVTANIKMQKIINIYEHIGKIPVFAGGNTDGDFSMLNYAETCAYPDSHMSLFIWHDDEREVVYNVSDEWKTLAEQYGWERVSMKDQFKTVFMK